MYVTINLLFANTQYIKAFDLSMKGIIFYNDFKQIKYHTIFDILKRKIIIFHELIYDFFEWKTVNITIVVKVFLLFYK